MNIQSAAATDDEVATLKAMRDKLAAAMDEADPAVVAQIAGRLEAVLKRIGELCPTRKETLADVLDRRPDTGAAHHPPRSKRKAKPAR